MTLILRRALIVEQKGGGWTGEGLNGRTMLTVRDRLKLSANPPAASKENL